MTEQNQHAPVDHQETLGDLFERVQMSRLYPSSQEFADAACTSPPDAILDAYRASEQSKRDSRGLERFVRKHFHCTQDASHRPQAGHHNQVEPRINARGNIIAEMQGNWPILIKSASDAEGLWTPRIPLRHPYIASDSHSDVLRYTDSYFAMLGLLESGDLDTARGILDNLVDLIDAYGHIPIANKAYCLGISGAPYFWLMVHLYASHAGQQAAQIYLPALWKEYDHWMEGHAELQPGQANRRVLRLADGTILNRYWSASTKPRTFAYAEDVKLANPFTQDRRERLWRDLRAADASGWGLASRWIEHPGDISSLRTTDTIPVDLNSLMLGMEHYLLDVTDPGSGLRTKAQIEATIERSIWRRAAIERKFYDPQRHWYMDLHRQSEEPTAAMTLAGMFPLYIGSAKAENAFDASTTLREHFLRPGGLATSLHETPYAFDGDHGFAHLQWISLTGLLRYGQGYLARAAAGRWLDLNERVWIETGRIASRYELSADNTAAAIDEGRKHCSSATQGVYLAMRAILRQQPVA